MTKDHQEKQFWDKPSPPFVELQGGLPYDFVLYRGERYLASLRIGSESGLAPLERGQLRITQSDQSGFLIETPNASLLFDWYRSALPPLRRDKPLHVFISHIHQDHFNRSLLRLADHFPEVSIYLGYDYSQDGLNAFLEKLPEPCADTVSCFQGTLPLEIEGGWVRSLESTDLGVAFLVELDGLRFFHGGDLFPWQGSEEAFLESISPLKDLRIDYAMLPLDPRFPEAARFGLTAYLSQAEIGCFTPMHLWNRPEFVKSFFAAHRELGQRMRFVFPGEPEQTLRIGGRSGLLRSAAYRKAV